MCSPESKINACEEAIGFPTPLRYDLEDLIRINDYFHPPALPSYDPDSLHKRALSRLRAIQHHVRIDGKRILDIGSGTGEMVRVLASQSNLSIGLDVEMWSMAPDNNSTLSELKTFDSYESSLLVCADAAHIPFEDSFFDLLTCFWTFEHIVNYRQALQEFRRVVVPGGVLYLDIAPLYYSPLGHHLFMWIYLPWCHLLFDREVIIQYLIKIDKTQWLRHFLELNKLTASEIQSSVEEAGLEILCFEKDYEQLGDLYGLFRDKLSRYSVEDLTCTRVFCLLRKPNCEF